MNYLIIMNQKNIKNYKLTNMNKKTIFTISMLFLIFVAFAQDAAKVQRMGLTPKGNIIQGIGEKQTNFVSPTRPAFETILETKDENIDKSTQAVLLEEYFDTWPPQNWTIINNGPVGEWMYDAGSMSSLHIWEEGGNDNWLISPPMTLDANNYQLTFRDFGSGWTETTCNVGISTGSGDPADGDFVSVYNPAAAGWWKENFIDLNVYNGEQIYIAFYADNAAVWRVDDVVVAPNTFVDGGLEAVVSPTGYSETGQIEDVYIKVKNYGTSNISELCIDWSVNGETQTQYCSDNANIIPDGESSISIGSYDFSANGLYAIEAELILDGDENTSNDQTAGEYSVGVSYDLVLKEVSPSGSYPNVQARNVVFTVINEGVETINDFTARLSVNETEELNIDFTSQNIAPGEIKQITVGSYTFVEGINELIGFVDVAYDLSPINNSLKESYTVGELYEGFQNPDFPPVAWKTIWGELDWWFPQYNDTSNTYVNMMGAEYNDINIVDTLFTPILNIEDGDMIDFRCFIPGAFDIPIMSIIAKDAETGEITVIADGITSSDNIWNDFSYDISAALGIQHIGFICDHLSSEPGLFRIDDIHTTASLHLENKDLMLHRVRTERIHYIGQETVIKANVKNYGLNDINGSDYTLELVNGAGEVLVTENGQDIASFDAIWFEINYVPENEGDDIYEVNLVYSADENLANNINKQMPVYIVAENTLENKTGELQETSLYAPFNAIRFSGYGANDLVQTIYYTHEIGSPGYIYGMSYQYKYCNEFGSSVPLKVWLAPSNQNDLESDWFPVEEMTLVYDNTIYIDHNITGEGTLFIPFDEPYFYDGTSNLITQHFTEEPSFFFTNTNFWHSSSEGVIRTRSAIEEDQSPTNPHEYPNLIERFPVTTFVIKPADDVSGIISGIVYDENDIPVEGADISIDNSTVTAITDENGYYELQPMLYDDYSITASYYGYDDLSQGISLIEEVQALDFHLGLRPQINISAHIVGSNDENIPLDNVGFIMEGYSTYIETSTENGDILISNVYGNTYYKVTLSLHGYYDYVIDSLVIEAEDYDLETLQMEEEFISAFNVIAEYGNGAGSVDWEEPINSERSIVINDLDYDQDGLASDIMEEVWIGNKFDNSGIITLTSVDLYWTIDLNGSEQEVIVDVLDEDGELIGSSLSFITPYFQWMTLDLPNLTITGDYYVMVHWKNNPQTSHFLGLCYDWDFIMPNTAYIKYPGSDPILLSLFWDPTGVNLPNYAMFVRPHIMELGGKNDDRAVLSYNLYRGEANDIANGTDWMQINEEPILSTDYIDQTTSGITGEMRYAVEAIYAEGNSEFCYSNKVDFLVGVEGVEDMSFRVYPNPAKDYLQITTSEKLNMVEIYNATGVLVYSERVEGQQVSINTKGFSSGVYMLKLKSGNNTISKKILIRE